MVFKNRSLIFYRFASHIVIKDMDDKLITWLLLAICVPHAFKNPYLVAKIIEVLFVLNTSMQTTEHLYSRIMTHQISTQYLAPYLMKFYTGTYNVNVNVNIKGRLKI